MRILHITDFGAAGKINGVSEAVLNLAKAQIGIGAEVRVAHTRPNTLVHEDFCSLLDNLRNFKTFICDYKPNIVIFNSFYDLKHPLFARILKRKKIPYVITFHGGASCKNYQKHHLRKFIANNLIFKSYVRNAKAVCYLNENERQSSIFLTTNRNSIIIPNGITMPDYIPQEYDSRQPIEILFFSRLDYIGKGLDVLLESINSIKDWLIDNNVHFSFYGYHYNDGTVEKIQSVGDVCQYKGYVVGNEKETIFKHADIMILPSRSEGMPVSIIEALSYGIPCIVTPETNMADIIEDYKCGWVTKLSKTGLLNSIKRAVNTYKNESYNLHKNAKKAAEAYEWNSIATDSTTKYHNILNEK